MFNLYLNLILYVLIIRIKGILVVITGHREVESLFWPQAWVWSHQGTFTSII